MRLLSFQIKNYRSIINSGVVKLSEKDNVSVFAGQNESGKSAILRALYDFEREEFEEDSLPFSIRESPDQPNQIVSCTYKIGPDEDIAELLSEITIDEHDIKIEEGQNILDPNKIKKIKKFTITRINGKEKVQITIDNNSFKIFQAAILNKPQQSDEGGKDKEKEKGEEKETTDTKEKYISFSDDQNADVAQIFWLITPNIVFFDDFCDLLPDKIFLSALKEKKTETKGYRAVKSLEKILNTDFLKKDSETDPIRRTKEDKENTELSINFQQDWGQRIHDENEVLVKYDFQKRNGEGENGSYINFYVETREGEPLPPKQRSKGLIWFLSLWLELKAQDIKNEDLILLLDEPDQHLHVKAQKDILKLINKLASEDDQVIYATHSPYLIEVDYLNRVKLVLNIKDGGTQIEDIVTSKIDTEYKKDALQPIANAIGLHVSEFSPLGNKNIILEGISDYYYFSAMKKILNRKGDYYFVPGIGVRQINNLISLSIGYGLNWISIIDDDPEKGGKDSKRKFDEIKDYVFDGDEAKTQQKVFILKGITGIENMFTYDDFKLIDPKINRSRDKVDVVGRKRKVLFSKLFFEKVNNREITERNISKTAKDNFNKAFDFIGQNF